MSSGPTSACVLPTTRARRGAGATAHAPWMKGILEARAIVERPSALELPLKRLLAHCTDNQLRWNSPVLLPHGLRLQTICSETFSDFRLYAGATQASAMALRCHANSANEIHYNLKNGLGFAFQVRAECRHRTGRESIEYGLAHPTNTSTSNLADAVTTLHWAVHCDTVSGERWAVCMKLQDRSNITHGV